MHARIVRFIPKETPRCILEEKDFWKFIKLIFRQPRRTIANNLASLPDVYTLPENIASKRAQQFSYDELVDLWNNRLVSALAPQ